MLVNHIIINYEKHFPFNQYICNCLAIRHMVSYRRKYEFADTLRFQVNYLGICNQYKLKKNQCGIGCIYLWMNTGETESGRRQRMSGELGSGMPR